MNLSQKRALLSVSDKSGIAALAAALWEKGFEIVSSGGTFQHLSEAGLHPVKVSELTDFPEILDGRVKTLHPRIHGALLARYELEDHRAQLESHGIAAFHLAVVNLYPFARTVARPAVTVAEAVEQIDIGGPAMVRATAKNFQNLTILTEPGDYDRFLAAMGEDGLPPLGFRLEMAQKAFQHTFAYDMKIADFLDGVRLSERGLVHGSGAELPRVFRFSARRNQSLRYGENPHQRAALYLPEGRPDGDAIFQHQGKQLSFNNLVDTESAWRCVLDFERPTAVIVKHTNPCGVGCHQRLESAFRRARQVDPVSAFGGVIAFNRELDLDTAKAVNEQFAELVIAPAFSQQALKRFRRKKNLRVLEVRTLPESGYRGLDFKLLDQGFLLQDKDLKRVPCGQWRLVSERAAGEAERAALEIAWKIVAHVKSNAVVYAGTDGAVGIGAGQMSRVDSARIGIHKATQANLPIAGSAMASDAFFPFRDSVDAAAQAGVRAIVEPGGSIRDDEVIAAANEHDIALYLTDTRHFRH